VSRHSIDLDALRRAVVRDVVAILVGALAATDKPSVYSTRRGCAPPGFADRAWKALAPTLPGATKRGRWTVVARADFDRWEAAQGATSGATSAANDTTSEPWSPETSALALGLRASR
jgi:hypothetical protein